MIVSLEDTAPEDAEGVTVEVEVKTEVSEEVAQSEKNVLNGALMSDDEIAIVYEVKLIRTTIEDGVEIREEIQPSDIKPGTVVVINLPIPEDLRGKPFKLLHIHSEEDIKEVTSYVISEDGATLTVRVDRLSEFVFVGKAASDEEIVEPNKIPDGAIAGIVIGGSIGSLLLGFLIIFLLKRDKKSADSAEEATTEKAAKTKKTRAPVAKKETKALAPKAKPQKKAKTAGKETPKAPASAIIVAAAVTGEEKNVGFYRITEAGTGKYTFALLYAEGDNLSKEMGVFESEAEAKSAIRTLRTLAKGAKAENRVRPSDETVPAPKFVLDVTEKGVYYYEFITADGEALLQSVQYLNEKRCLVDLQKTLLCVTTNKIVDPSGTACEDAATSALTSAIETAPAAAPVEAATEEVTPTEIVEEKPAEASEIAEEPMEAVSLKEHVAAARATESHGSVNKRYVADYLKRKYADGAEVHMRANETKTGLPLADTHYAITEDGKTCFVYVYEVAGTTMLLVKVNDAYGRALAKKHPIVKRSAFPKSKSAWYSVIVDDSFAPEEIEKILDDAYAQNGGKAASDEGVSLKSTLARAKAATSNDARTKKGIADFLASEFGDAAEINRRANKTRTGLPLADTHYAVTADGKRCFAYVYEIEGTVALLLRLSEDYAETVRKSGHKIIRSAFPKSKDAWYSVIVDDTYGETDVTSLLVAAYNHAK